MKYCDCEYGKCEGRGTARCVFYFADKRNKAITNSTVEDLKKRIETLTTQLQTSLGKRREHLEQLKRLYALARKVKKLIEVELEGGNLDTPYENLKKEYFEIVENLEVEH